jgi:hypothetical protein
VLQPLSLRAAPLQLLVEDLVLADHLPQVVGRRRQLGVLRDTLLLRPSGRRLGRGQRAAQLLRLRLRRRQQRRLARGLVRARLQRALGVGRRLQRAVEPLARRREALGLYRGW